MLLLCVTVSSSRSLLAQERNQESAAIAALRRIGARIDTDARDPRNPAVSISLANVKATVPVSAYAPLQHLSAVRAVKFAGNEIGDDHVQYIKRLKSLETIEFEECGITDKGVGELAELTKLKALRFSVCRRVTDEGIAKLGKLLELEVLELTYTGVTGKGFDELTSLSKLKELDVSDSSFTDDGLKKLKALKGLQVLILWYNFGVTDRGLDHLKAIPRLRLVAVAYTKVTEEGVAAFRRARPDVKISRD